jgi:hypothetical protein
MGARDHVRIAILVCVTTSIFDDHRGSRPRAAIRRQIG